MNIWIAETKAAMAQVDLWFNGLQTQITDSDAFGIAVTNAVALRQGVVAKSLVDASTSLTALPAAQTAIASIATVSATATAATANIASTATPAASNAKPASP